MSLWSVATYIACTVIAVAALVQAFALRLSLRVSLRPSPAARDGK
jgi:hypothetical protein